MNKKYDIVCVGAGISGATLAERYASLGKKVLVIDKRDHIAGNCFDYVNEHGILVSKYGPHYFHTNYDDVWRYVNQFTKFNEYQHRVLSYVDGKLVPVPVNIDTVNQLFGENITTEEQMKIWLENHTENIETPQNSEESSLRRVGRDLYEKMFKGYTKKQWDMYPSELEASVMDRIPVRTNHDNRYFTDIHQGVPEYGYTKMFENILKNPNIEVRLNTTYEEVEKEIQGFEKLFFTGKIDSYFQEKLGKLQYRSLNFEFETLDQEWFQSHGQINYPNDHDYTRIVEYKHSTGQKHPKTTISKEYSTWDGEPYYPVPSQKNRNLYDKYKIEAEKLEKNGIFFVGRLANYKYFNMDQAFKNALDFFNMKEVTFKTSSLKNKKFYTKIEEQINREASSQTNISKL
jgi:UDP-galactopyranose mutase